MAVVEVDGVDVKPLQTLRECFSDILGIVSDRSCAVWQRHIPELGGEENLVTLARAFEPLA